MKSTIKLGCSKQILILISSNNKFRTRIVCRVLYCSTIQPNKIIEDDYI